MITLYSTDCPKCKVLKQKLDEKGVEYELITDVPTMLNLGFMSAPMLSVNDKVMEFSKAIEWIREG